MPLRNKVIAIILITLSLYSCSESSLATPQTQQAIPTIAFLAHPTQSAPTISIPTDTPPPLAITHTQIAPTSIDTPTPEGLNPHGPYVLIFGHSGVWLTNPDGSYPTRLSADEHSTPVDMHKYLSPKGDQLAMVTSNDQGLDLVLMKLPGGEAETLTHLIDSPSPGTYDPVSENAFAKYAIRDYESVAWQPGEGRYLAFTGATKGATSDLYLYDTQTREIKQLTDGPSQAIMPIWSPDGQYILHFGVSWVPPFGGAIVGANQFDGVWAVHAADGKVISLPKNTGDTPHFIGWLDDTHYITYDAGECSSQNLRSVDVTSGETKVLMEFSFYYYIAQAPRDGVIMFSSAEGCPDSLGEGIFLLPKGAAIPIKLFDKRAWEIDWMPESGVFDVYPEGLFTSDGRTHYDVPLYDKSYKPAVSKRGYQAWQVLENFQGRVVVKVGDGDWQTIYQGIVDGLIWDPINGQTLLIVAEDGSLYSASYPDFSPRLMGDLGGGVMQVIWAP